MQLHYLGKPLEDCSQAELVEAVKAAYGMYLKEAERHSKTLDALVGRATIAPPPVRELK